ncbi:MAG: hypothetical protein DRZ76_03315, partial [Candidatus Nealsonbacteria bacterium]
MVTEIEKIRISKETERWLEEVRMEEAERKRRERIRGAVVSFIVGSLIGVLSALVFVAATSAQEILRPIRADQVKLVLVIGFAFEQKDGSFDFRPLKDVKYRSSVDDRGRTWIHLPAPAGAILPLPTSVVRSGTPYLAIKKQISFQRGYALRSGGRIYEATSVVLARKFEVLNAYGVVIGTIGEAEYSKPTPCDGRRDRAVYNGHILFNSGVLIYLFPWDQARNCDWFDPTVTTNDQTYIGDAQINSDVPDSNFETQTVIFVQSYTSEDHRTYIQFDIRGFLDTVYGTNGNAIITDISIALHENDVVDSGVSPVEVRQPTAEWDDSTITWNNQPGVGTLLYSFAPANTGSATDTLNDSSLVDIFNDYYQQGGTAWKKGILLKAQTEGTTTRYRTTWDSEDSTTPGFRPTITITFTGVNLSLDDFRAVGTDGSTTYFYSLDTTPSSQSVSLVNGVYNTYRVFSDSTIYSGSSSVSLLYAGTGISDPTVYVVAVPGTGYYAIAENTLQNATWEFQLSSGGGGGGLLPGDKTLLGNWIASVSDEVNVESARVGGWVASVSSEVGNQIDKSGEWIKSVSAAVLASGDVIPSTGSVPLGGVSWRQLNDGKITVTMRALSLQSATPDISFGLLQTGDGSDVIIGAWNWAGVSDSFAYNKYAANWKIGNASVYVHYWRHTFDPNSATGTYEIVGSFFDGTHFRGFSRGLSIGNQPVIDTGGLLSSSDFNSFRSEWRIQSDSFVLA